MTTVTKTALVPYAAEKMYALVAEVERYPDFLPWCGGAQVHERGPDWMLASVTIAYRGLRQTFTTRNTLMPPEQIGLSLRDGPFAKLEGQWRFKALKPDACRIDFVLEYDMKSGLLSKLLGPIFNQIAVSMVDAFVKRADVLYGS